MKMIFVVNTVAMAPVFEGKPVARPAEAGRGPLPNSVRIEPPELAAEYKVTLPAASVPAAVSATTHPPPPGATDPTTIRKRVI